MGKTKEYVQLKKKTLFLWVSLIVCIIVFGTLGFFYQKYEMRLIDTSLNGSEISEIHQNKIPPDVKKTIIKDKSATIEASLRIPILMYHYIEIVQDKNDKTRIALATPPSVLDAQVKTLKDAGYIFLTMSEVADVLDGKTKLASPSVALTFDDGYQDFYDNAYPILKKYDAKATSYVITGFLDQHDHLTSMEVKQLSDEGLVEVGAHTVHHDWLKGKPLHEVTSETAQSKVTLEQLIGKPVVSFAYPFGAFDQQSIDVLKSIGFRTATSTIPGIAQSDLNRFFLFRLRPGYRVGVDLVNWLKQNSFNPW